MGFWSFLRDMFLFDWLFGQNRNDSSPNMNQNGNQSWNHQLNDDSYDYHNRNGYDHYGYNDYGQEDFDDDLDSGMFDDDF